MSRESPFIHYGNFKTVYAGGITLSHGIRPSVATIYCTPEPGPYPNRGTLAFTFDGVAIKFQDALLDEVSFDTESHTMVLRVKDRRWKWEYGRIRGEYNVPEGDGVRASTEKTPRELMELCLKAMGERKFNVAQVPNVARPYVNWDGNPAQELARLADYFGCRVVYDPITNGVFVVLAGVGKHLPGGFDVTSDSLDVNPPEIPDAFIFVAGKTIIDAYVELEAVGEDTDGTIKPIDDLSWKPSAADGGFKHCLPPEFTPIKKKYRHLAKKCLWRWYRPKSPVKLPIGFKAKGRRKFTIKSADIELQQLLPLEESRGQTKHVGKRKPGKKDVIKERLPAEIYGEFYGGYQVLGTTSKDYETPFGKLTKYDGGLSIDKERGVVKSSTPLYLFRDNTGKVTDSYDSKKGYVSTAEIYLYNGWGIRDEETHAWHREMVEYVPPGPKLGTLPHFIDREDIYRNVYLTGKSSAIKIVDNLKEVQKQAVHYLKNEFRKFQFLTPGARNYFGFVPIALDGAIHQVTWSIADSGEPSTTITRNREEILTVLSYDEQRRFDLQRSLLEKDRKKSTKRRKESDS